MQPSACMRALDTSYRRLIVLYMFAHTRQQLPMDPTRPHTHAGARARTCVIVYRQAQTTDTSHTHHTREESKRFEVLEDVTIFGCDENHVETVEWLVNVSAENNH